MSSTPVFAKTKDSAKRGRLDDSSDGSPNIEVRERNVDTADPREAKKARPRGLSACCCPQRLFDDDEPGDETDLRKNQNGTSTTGRRGPVAPTTKERQDFDRQDWILLKRVFTHAQVDEIVELAERTAEAEREAKKKASTGGDLADAAAQTSTTTSQILPEATDEEINTVSTSKRNPGTQFMRLQDKDKSAEMKVHFCKEMKRVLDLDFHLDNAGKVQVDDSKTDAELKDKATGLAVFTYEENQENHTHQDRITVERGPGSQIEQTAICMCSDPGVDFAGGRFFLNREFDYVEQDGKVVINENEKTRLYPEGFEKGDVVVFDNRAFVHGVEPVKRVEGATTVRRTTCSIRSTRPRQRGSLIVLEGPDKVGKTTLAKKLMQHLRKRNTNVAY
ncbi:unnamed protein product [Amoebophrya sp. A120]|nr:unnamed protein product [Amoebophrya sp. A120]|eukprot:GSA120T00021023001.1